MKKKGDRWDESVGVLLGNVPVVKLLPIGIKAEKRDRPTHPICP